MCDQIAAIKNAIMSEGMQHDLVEWATPALEKYKIEMTLQPILRRSLTRSTIPPVKHFIYFYLGQVTILFTSG
ncbi:hypothetical protein FD755_016083 [Muntiacus reevesi]|uniref:Uncharacterized protein n=1 Tax=Muntiacus reevesi TaxID=9886 RepID=A0A5N3XED4_MUNRE|nr:hypothetical protein FD755_016083 [Muntiacus reevesi]